jgi:hypothetical protein
MKRKANYMQILFFLLCIIGCLFQCSCGLVGLMSTPTRYEEEIPAEYKLADLEEKKILIFVEQPYWLDAKVNLR